CFATCCGGPGCARCKTETHTATAVRGSPYPWRRTCTEDGYRSDWSAKDSCDSGGGDDDRVEDEGSAREITRTAPALASCSSLLLYPFPPSLSLSLSLSLSP